MAEQTPQTIRAMLMSDAYWAGPFIDPLEGLGFRAIAKLGIEEGQVAKNREASHEIGGLVTSMITGVEVIGVTEPGEAIELPAENSREVVRIVRDTKSVYKASSREDRRNEREQAGYLALESDPHYSFEALAKQALNRTIYTDIWPQAFVETDGNLVTHIARQVFYARAAGSERFMLGRKSEELAPKYRGLKRPQALRRVPLGVPHRIGQNEVAKIISATTLRATDSSYKTPPKFKGSAGERVRARSRAWIPRPVSIR